jgi:hypothetical protein
MWLTDIFVDSVVRLSSSYLLTHPSFLFLVVLGFELRVLHMLGSALPLEPHPQPPILSFYQNPNGNQVPTHPQIT